MLKNKNINVLLAFIIAVALWIYVVGDVNPETNVTVKDIPIEIVNQETLSKDELTVLKSADESVDIRIKGSRSMVTRVKQSDFKVTADVEALKYGENVVRLNITGPEDVEIEWASIEKTVVIVDKLVSEEKNIDVVFQGVTPENSEPYVVEMHPNTVNVSGAKTIIEKIGNVNAMVDISNVGNTMKMVSANLTVADTNGNKISSVSLDKQKINVAVIMLQKKTVHLEVPVINENEGEYQRSVMAPKTIVIKGDQKSIEAINSVKCETIDLKKVKENTTIELQPILPDGVQISEDSAELKAEVIVKSFRTQTFTFSSDDVNLLNKVEGLQYKVESKTISIVVSGKEDDLKQFTAEDIKLKVDVNDLSEGEHTVKLIVECEKTVSSIESSVKVLQILIK